MTIQTLAQQLAQTELTIADCRSTVADLEVQRLGYRAVVADAETRLAIARAAAMADPAAGTNDNSRRAYADAQTADDRLRAGFANDDLRLAEKLLIIAECDLRIAEDQRRTLESCLRLAVAGLADHAGIDYSSVWADDDDAAPDYSADDIAYDAPDFGLATERAA